ncbi:restriction endonuclease subunit S [Streptococcus cristatus]|uniref:restriction endonuclease subunit S n=1 Tax=Streptococcus cristatus TaxID=45634 RepID=UPI002167F1E6|nr:restriction endonuclease subunit S [Streptococcus cristatus]
MGNKKIPKIRFNNSKIDWQQVKFKNLLNSEEGIRRGPFGSALKKELFVQNSEYVVYEQQNAIYDHFNTRYRISEEKYHELKKFILLHGDFIMSGAGTIGKISLVPEGIEKGVFNQALIRLRVNRNTDKEFFLQWMRSPEMQNKLTKANPASAMVNLVPMSEVKEWEVIVPSLDEQSAIGSLFRTLDDLIASYKDNLTNYQSLKATMLSKMFPKAGQTVPEIRLNGFDAEWEIRKLSEVSEVYDGTHQTPNYTESGVKFLSVENISTLESEKYISEEDFEKDFKVFPEFGDVLMTRIGSIGVPNIVKTNEKIAFYVSLALLKPKKKTNSLFMKSSIESNPFQEELWKKTLHIAFPKKINKNDISQSTIKCPSYEEQQAIGIYFSNLDNLINSHQEKISQLETLKKKLLQDMFI